MAKKVKLRVDQDSTYTHTFQYREEDETTVIPLTGYTAEMFIWESLDDAAPAWTGSTTTGELTIDEPNGEVTVEIPDEDSAAWTFLEGVYLLEIEPADGKKIRLVQGVVVVDPDGNHS